MLENTILPGKIALANETRFNAAFFSEPLTEYASGWREPNDLEELLDFVAPPVQVGRRFEYKRADNAEAFLLDVDDYRAIGGDFKRVEYRGSSVNEKTLNRGLTIRVDLDAHAGLARTTTRLLQRLRTQARGRSPRQQRHKRPRPGTPPLERIRIRTSSPNSSLRTTVLAFAPIESCSATSPGTSVSSHIAPNPVPGGFASAAFSLDELASHLLVDGVRISRERYQSSAAAKSKITPDVVLLFFGMDRASTEDPTSAKRFWSPIDGGGKFRVYEQQVSAKLVDITVEYYSNVILTSSVGLRKLTIS